MKDKDGNPIVALPEKHIKIEYLAFTSEERKIYDVRTGVRSSRAKLTPLFL